MKTAYTQDEFLGGSLRIWQSQTGYRGGTDPVLLAAACPAQARQTVLDLGCGTGIAALCLARRVPGVCLTGLDINADHVALAQKNAAENVIALDVIAGDVSCPPAALKAQRFNHVICNPPYFGPGTAAKDISREQALRPTVPLETWFGQALRRTAPKGSVTFILSTQYLPKVLRTFDTKAGAIRVLPLTSRAHHPAKRVIVQAWIGRKTPLLLLPPFILHSGPHHTGDWDDYSTSAQKVLREGRALPLSGER